MDYLNRRKGEVDAAICQKESELYALIADKTSDVRIIELLQQSLKSDYLEKELLMKALFSPVLTTTTTQGKNTHSPPLILFLLYFFKRWRIRR